MEPRELFHFGVPLCMCQIEGHEELQAAEVWCMLGTMLQSRP
jgi:hypothetical protein